MQKYTFKDRVQLEKSTITSRHSNDLQEAINCENYELAQALKELNESEISSIKDSDWELVLKSGKSSLYCADRPGKDFIPFGSLPKIPEHLEAFLKEQKIFDAFVANLSKDACFDDVSMYEYFTYAFAWGNTAQESGFWGSVDDNWCKYMKENGLKED